MSPRERDELVDFSNFLRSVLHGVSAPKSAQVRVDVITDRFVRYTFVTNEAPVIDHNGHGTVIINDINTMSVDGEDVADQGMHVFMLNTVREIHVQEWVAEKPTNTSN